MLAMAEKNSANREYKNCSLLANRKGYSVKLAPFCDAYCR